MAAPVKEPPKKTQDQSNREWWKELVLKHPEVDRFTTPAEWLAWQPTHPEYPLYLWEYKLVADATAMPNPEKEVEKKKEKQEKEKKLHGIHIEEKRPDEDLAIILPTEELQIDPRYKQIQDELAKKKEDEWKKANEGKSESEKLADPTYTTYFSADLTDPRNKGWIEAKQKGTEPPISQPYSPLTHDAEKIFRERYREDAARFDEAEKQRVYDNPYRDPTFQQVLTHIAKGEKEELPDETHENKEQRLKLKRYKTLEHFAKQFPKKAQSYQNDHKELRESLALAALRERTRTQSPQTNPSKPLESIRSMRRFIPMRRPIEPISQETSYDFSQDRDDNPGFVSQGIDMFNHARDVYDTIRRGRQILNVARGLLGRGAATAAGESVAGGAAATGAAAGAAATGAAVVAEGAVATEGAVVAGGGLLAFFATPPGWVVLGVIAIIFVIIIVLAIVLMVSFSSQSSSPSGVSAPANGSIAACQFYRGSSAPLSYKSPQLLSYFQEASQKSGIPAAVLAAVARVESPSLATLSDEQVANYQNTCAESPTGALGPMQIQPAGTKGHDAGAVGKGASYIGIPYESLTRADYCDVRKNIMMGAGFINQKRIYATKKEWDQTQLDNREYIDSVASTYYGCLRYPSCESGPNSYGEDIWNSVQACRSSTTNVAGGGWPVSGVIEQGPGGSTSHAGVYAKRQAEAIDISNSSSPDVYSTITGTVSNVSACGDIDTCSSFDYGNYVEITTSTKDVVLRYAHLSKIYVKLGDPISPGDKIGKMGTTGMSSGIHLHYDVTGARMAPPFIPQALNPTNCDSPQIPCSPSSISYQLSSTGITTPTIANQTVAGGQYWFLLHRTSKKEFLYKGQPGNVQKSIIVSPKNDNQPLTVNVGRFRDDPTPLPSELGKEYWLITKRAESNDNNKLGPYFFTLNIPVGGPFKGPAPYLYCDPGGNSQCTWTEDGAFGLHGVGNTATRLTDSGSSGCIRHTNEDIKWLYETLSTNPDPIRYYIDDN